MTNAKEQKFLNFDRYDSAIRGINLYFVGHYKVSVQFSIFVFVHSVKRKMTLFVAIEGMCVESTEFCLQARIDR